MRRSMPLAVLSIAVSLIACGGPPERASTITPPPPSATPAATPTATATTPPEPPKPPDSADLKKLLLSLDDMPSGWSQEKDDSSTPESVKPASCKAIYAPLQGMKAKSATKFTHGQVEEIRERIYSFDGSPDQALDAQQKVWEDCSLIKISDHGTNVTFKAAPVSFKNYGNRALAVRVTASSSGFTFISDTVYTRVDDLIVQLQSFGTNPLDALEPVVKSAVEKIKAG